MDDLFCEECGIDGVEIDETVGLCEVCFETIFRTLDGFRE